MTLFGCFPSTMKPPITTLSPVSTKARVLIFVSVDSVRVVGVVPITRLLVPPTRQTTTNNGRRSSFFILGGWRLRIFAVHRFVRGSVRILGLGFGGAMCCHEICPLVNSDDKLVNNNLNNCILFFAEEF